MKLPRITKFSSAEVNLFSMIGMAPKKIPQHDFLGFNIAVTRLMEWFSDKYGDKIRVPPTRLETMSSQLKLRFQGARLKYQFPGKSKTQRHIKAEWNCYYNALHVAVTPNCSLNSWNGLRYSSFRSYNAMDPWVMHAFKVYNEDLLNETRGWSKQQATRAELSTLVMDYFCKDSKLPPRRGSRSARAFAKATEVVKERWKIKGGATPLEMNKAIKFIHRETSPGYTFHGKKTKDVITEIYKAGEKLRASFFKPPEERTVRPPPCKLGSRGHLSPWEDRKLRLIWIYPAEMKLIELCFSVPLTAAYVDISENRKDFPMLVGNRTIPRISNVCYQEYADCSAIRTDFSGWDFNVPDWVIYRSFEVLFSNFDLEKWKTNKPDEKANNALKIRRMMEAISHYFINTPFCTPYGVIGRKRNGKVPSGSCFTSLVDSVAQDLVNTTADIMLGLFNKTQFIDRYPSGIRMSYVRSLVVGDDGHRVYPNDVLIGKGWYRESKLSKKKIADIKQYALAFGRVTKRVFGETLNVEKTEFNDGGIENGVRTFLGYTFKNYRLFRETKEWLMMALYSEKEVPDVYVSATRMLAYFSLGGEYDDTFGELFNTFFDLYSFDENYQLETEYRMRKHLRRLFGLQHPLLRRVISIGKISLLDYHNLLFRYPNSGTLREPKFNKIYDTRQLALEKLQPADPEVEDFHPGEEEILEVEDYLDDVVLNKGGQLLDLRHVDYG